MVGIHLYLGFPLLLPLPLFAQPQLLAPSLEVLDSLGFNCGIDSRRETLDRDSCIQAIRIAARFLRIAAALHEHAIEGDAILHEIRYRHRRNVPWTARWRRQHHSGHPP